MVTRYFRGGEECGSTIVSCYLLSSKKRYVALRFHLLSVNSDGDGRSQTQPFHVSSCPVTYTSDVLQEGWSIRLHILSRSIPLMKLCWGKYCMVLPDHDEAE